MYLMKAAPVQLMVLGAVGADARTNAAEKVPTDRMQKAVLARLSGICA